MVYINTDNKYVRIAFNKWFNNREKIINKLCSTISKLTHKAEENEVVDAYMNNISGIRRMAAVLDIDETLLCNMHENKFYDQQSETVKTINDLYFPKNTYFHNINGKTVKRDPALPGVHNLIKELERCKLNIFFVTGRKENIRDITTLDLDCFEYSSKQVKRMVQLKKQYNEETDEITLVANEFNRERLIMVPNDYNKSMYEFKTNVRKKIEEKYRIVFNIGDQFSDMGKYADNNIRLENNFYVVN